MNEPKWLYLCGKKRCGAEAVKATLLDGCLVLECEDHIGQVLENAQKWHKAQEKNEGNH